MFYSIEFLLYPYLYVFGLILLFITTKGNPVYFSGGFVIYNVFWLVFYGLLSLGYNFLPCVTVLKHGIGWC